MPKERDYSAEFDALPAEQKDLFYTLVSAANRIRGAYRDQVLYYIGQAELNANQTVFDEKAQPASEWACMFRESIVTMLSHRSRENLPFRVPAFFVRHGIRI